ncbi:MAG: hypothetical protein AAGF11_33395 [Myxococcota bacterium]
MMAAAFVLVAVSATGCNEVTLEDGSTPPSLQSSSFIQNCLISTDEDCFREQANQAATEAKLEELRREEIRTRGVMHDQAEQQRRATMRAAGLDPDTGTGFWCFEGTMAGRPLGECRRSQDACIDRLMFRERNGLEVGDRRCTRHAQAACFRLTRTLEEGERVMCFDQVSTCERLHGSVDPEGFMAPPTECEVAD